VSRLPDGAGAARLTLLGYWSGPESSGWPDVQRFVDPDWDADERALVWSYLNHGLVARAYLGPSFCTICGAKNGSLEFTDGRFIWPEGLAHYVREHSVRLPREFTDHARARTREYEETPKDDTWWRTLDGGK
jgi:hypothetical protein